MKGEVIRRSGARRDLVAITGTTLAKLEYGLPTDSLPLLKLHFVARPTCPA